MASVCPLFGVLISALTQAGGDDLLFMFVSLVQSRCGRAGLCRQMSLCVGSTRRVLARQPAVLAPSPRVLRTFSLRGERPGQPEVWCSLHRRAAPFPSVAPALAGRVSEVFRQERGPVCRVGGGGFSGAEFSPFPSPCLLPPAGMGRLLSGVSQSLCFVNRQQCVPAGQFFSRSPTV